MWQGSLPYGNARARSMCKYTHFYYVEKARDGWQYRKKEKYMNKKVLHTLEFDKITERLCEFASSNKAKEKISGLIPMADIDEINKAQKETADALARVYQSGHISFSEIGRAHV